MGSMLSMLHVHMCPAGQRAQHAQRAHGHKEGDQSYVRTLAIQVGNTAAC